MIEKIDMTAFSEQTQKPFPKFDRRIFWDVNFDKLDYDNRADFIIERVFERGDVEDIRQCRRYYGDKKIEEALTNAKWLLKETIFFATAILNNQKSDYRCYRQAQSNPQLWTY